MIYDINTNSYENSRKQLKRNILNSLRHCFQVYSKYVETEAKAELCF